MLGIQRLREGEKLASLLQVFAHESVPHRTLALVDTRLPRGVVAHRSEEVKAIEREDLVS